MEPFFLTFLKVLAIAVIFFALGLFSLNAFFVKIERPVYRFFIQQLTGLCIFVFSISVFFTGGKTIMLGFVFIAFGFLYNKRKHFQFGFIRKGEFWKALLDKKVIIASLLGLLSIFLIEYFLFYPGNNLVALPHMDYIYYSKISKFLTTFGIESNLPEFIYPETVYPTPYHYMELWLNSGISLLFGGNHLINLFLITIPYGLFLTWIGLIALAETISKKNILTYFLGLIALFFMGLRVPYLEAFPLFKEIPYFVHNPWNFPKLLPIFWFVIPVVISILNRQKTHAFLFLACLVIAYVSTIPGVFAVIVIWTLIDFLRFGFKMKTGEVAAIATLFFYFIFYLSFLNFRTSENSLFVYFRINDIQYWKTAINIIVKSSFQVALLFLPVHVLILVHFFSKKKFNLSFKSQPEFWVFVIGILFFSLLAWAIFHPLLDSVQFFTNINGVLMVILFLALTISLLENLKFIRAFVLIFFLIFALPGLRETLAGKRILGPQKISIIELESLKKKIGGQNHFGVFFYNAQNGELFYKNPTVNTLGQELSLIFPDIQFISLSVFDNLQTEDNLYVSKEVSFLKNSTFFKFVQDQKNKGTFRSTEQSQYDFIAEQKISIMLSNEDFELPEKVSGLIKETHKLQKGNEILYFLK